MILFSIKSVKILLTLHSLKRLQKRYNFSWKNCLNGNYNFSTCFYNFSGMCIYLLLFKVINIVLAIHVVYLILIHYIVRDLVRISKFIYDNKLEKRDTSTAASWHCLLLYILNSILLTTSFTYPCFQVILYFKKKICGISTTF